MLTGGTYIIEYVLYTVHARGRIVTHDLFGDSRVGLIARCRNTNTIVCIYSTPPVYLYSPQTYICALSY